MRKLILLMHISLDGFVAGPKGELNWVIHDDEIFKYVTEHFQNVDMALYGRTTYQIMESYWPTVLKNKSATKQELHHAKWYDQIKKVVFSTTLKEPTSKNTIIIKDNVKEEILKLKQEKGKNMMIFGSPRLTYSLLQLGVVDEFLINVNPVILGNGIPLAKEMKDKTCLKLLKSTTFKSGVIGLYSQKVS